MEQNKNPTASPKAGKPEQPLTEEQRQKRRKMLVYPLMGLLFAGSMWLIFAPSEKEKAEAAQGTGFNTEMPLPAESGIIADKRTAYEQARMEEKQKERRAQMHDLADLFADKEQDKETAAEDFDLLNPEAGVQPAPSYGGGGSRPKQTIRLSAAAYEDINRTLGNFYEMPADDPEKEELHERIEELEAMMARQSAPEGSTLDDQVALLEKSYELAAKYMPAGQGGASQAAATGKPEQKPSRNGKAVAVPVNQVAVNVVSALAQPMDDAEFMRTHAAERNYGFHTAVGNTGAAEKNTIAACVHGNQTVTDGQSVRLRLLEATDVGGVRIPRNTLVVGAARVQGERLGVEITSLEYRGSIIPVELSVFDSDGQEGIFIPNSLEVSAVKEIAANMGSSLGSSINISTDAGAQLASDLGKGVIQGTSQYIAQKMRTVKVHLKAGYKVMLYQPED
ncbi:conjugative transposon protein TraM [Parabacteroides faecis]|uniref:conjugative transposon protein TraM n=1 Tax=Parabacteroides faecis TaxID=1217282 RepID=UPI0021649AC6|nr:conjugative transposon protein TraM [Parabacteroides faecis]MCS2889908.1 conjugative transposon protein TraM [Parabacteroides faecis]UVQ46393.1 conjugative transposon protein TraM [Parabacteroides faecis]